MSSFIAQLVRLVLQLSLTRVQAYVWTIAMKPLHAPYKNKQAFQGSPYWLASLRLIIQLIMVNNFPLSSIEMIRYTKRLDEDWNRPLFCFVQSRQHKPKDVGTCSYSKSSCNSIIGSLAFLLERWTLCLKSNNVKSVQIVRCFTESCR